MDIKSVSSLYTVEKMVADAEKYRLYLCKQEITERQCLLQIATATEHNSGLDRAAYILKELKRRSDEIEEEYARVKTDHKDMLNYDLGFPEIVDSFICHEQAGRRVNVLAFKNVPDVSKMVPVVNITTRNHRRVDLRTSAWMMGKLLKLLVFAHSEDIAANLLTSSNILIDPFQHYILIFDWSEAQIHQDNLSFELRCKEISQAAQAVIAVLGGNFPSGVIPNDGDDVFDCYTDNLTEVDEILEKNQEAFDRYTGFLLKLAGGHESKAERAHAMFYELIDKLWKRRFYPFTTKPL